VRCELGLLSLPVLRRSMSNLRWLWPALYQTRTMCSRLDASVSATDEFSTATGNQSSAGLALAVAASARLPDLMRVISGRDARTEAPAWQWWYALVSTVGVEDEHASGQDQDIHRERHEATRHARSRRA
jgi:hypothetical protein